MENLVKMLEPEIKDFQSLIKNMALVNSPYKDEFNYMKVLVNQEKLKDLEGKIHLVINELNQFGQILEKIVEDDEASEQYVNAGLLDKCIELQKRILSKLS